MLILLIIYLTTMFFTVWLNAKIIKDASGKDQYWHIVQFYQICWMYLSYGILIWVYNQEFPKHYVEVTIGFALMYMLLYNSLLNILRRMKISHLGRYDKFSFKTTIILFIVGFIWLVIYGVFL